MAINALANRFTVALCRGHHRNEFTATQKLSLTVEEQASIAGGRKSFNKVFGTERQLLEKTDFLLGLDTPSPKTKIVARRAA